MRLDDGANDGQGAGHHVHAALAARGRDGEGVFLPARVLVVELGLDLLAPQTLPVTVIDLAQAGSSHRRHPVRVGED